LISKYGKIMDLDIDASQKKIHLIVLPKGEEKPIEIDADYKLEENAGSLNLTITKVKTNREWLTLLGSDFLPYTRENIPGVAKMVL
jgi:hypothetical protein